MGFPCWGRLVGLCFTFIAHLRLHESVPCIDSKHFLHARPAPLMPTSGLLVLYCNWTPETLNP